MSYILDALKKAESERERGLVPGLHTQALPATAPASPPGGVVRPLLYGGGLALLLALGSATFVLWRGAVPSGLPAPGAVTPTVPQPTSNAISVAATGSAAPAQPPAPAAPAPAPVAQIPIAKPPVTPDNRPGTPPAPVADANPAASRPRPSMAPAQITPVTPAEPATALAAPAAASTMDSPALARPATPAPAPATVPAAPPRVVAQLSTGSPAISAPATVAAAQSRIPTLNELPADVRQGLPKLTISGATYSDNPAWRMLIINGQVFHEGERPAADLQLEQIRPKSAVLNYRGQRYQLGY